MVARGTRKRPSDNRKGVRSLPYRHHHAARGPLTLEIYDLGVYGGSGYSDPVLI
jgi:hypothetical protein